MSDATAPKTRTFFNQFSHQKMPYIYHKKQLKHYKSNIYNTQIFNQINTDNTLKMSRNIDFFYEKN